MPPAVERSEHSRRHSPDRSDLLVRNRHSPRRRSSPRRERTPTRKSSPKARSPYRNNSFHRAGSPVKEKAHIRLRSPKENRQRSPVRSSSSSPSPRTRRLRRAQADREAEKLAERERGRNSGREEREKGRQRERGDGDDSHAHGERRLVRDRSDDVASRPSRRDESPSVDHNHIRRHRSRSPSMSSKAVARHEVSQQKPSFELSGKLAEETNRVRGIALLFTEPSDACKPDIRWRLYVFKGGEVLNEPLYVHRQSCYLFGRERRVADIPTDHPSCSKQHSVLQYRCVEKEQPDGLMSKQVRPYLMDLGSTNGTFINDNRIEPQRYYELFEKDTIKFGNSRYAH
ncbi:FHA domain-containing protein DDL [Apostasia shenzhenica]|uniref:FHA domain-containing protein DDL n=1 Tax=Apostasia shenzhenica TaxID=1088818 RepID=A0A2I0B354_9ASPA|nr:FHA domain-containing protein DDL [Apostasia shenzhenica]